MEYIELYIGFVVFLVVVTRLVRWVAVVKDWDIPEFLDFLDRVTNFFSLGLWGLITGSRRQGYHPGTRHYFDRVRFRNKDE